MGMYIPLIHKKQWLEANGGRPLTEKELFDLYNGNDGEDAVMPKANSTILAYIPGRDLLGIVFNNTEMHRFIQRERDGVEFYYIPTEVLEPYVSGATYDDLCESSIW